MYTIDKEVKTEQEINKSVFITYLKPVTTVEDAKAYISYVKELHPDATHHISCYTVGNTGEYGHTTDDGEPSGTAGLPLLDVFRKNDLTNFVCIVVRYFGGIKLGAGGLVRAYSSSGSMALKEANIIPIITYTSFKATFHYSYLGLIQNTINNDYIVDKTFSSNVTVTFKLPVSEEEKTKALLIELTNNQITIQ